MDLAVSENNMPNDPDNPGSVSVGRYCDEETLEQEAKLLVREMNIFMLDSHFRCEH